MIHNIGQEGDLHVAEPEEQKRSFDALRIKYINIDSVKSVIFIRIYHKSKMSMYSIKS